MFAHMPLVVVLDQRRERRLLLLAAQAHLRRMGIARQPSLAGGR